jgi:Rha family phage regulatory protein
MSSTDLLPANAVTLHDGRAFTTSLLVAEVFGKLHKHVLRDIEALDCSPEFHGSNFGPMFRDVVVGNGAVRQERYFELTKNGFVFLVMGYTGAKAARFKEAYIARFDEMEAALRTGPRPISADGFFVTWDEWYIVALPLPNQTAEHRRMQLVKRIEREAAARATAPGPDVLRLRQALLEKCPVWDRVYRCRRAGLTTLEISRVLECGETTTRRHLREMRAVGLLPGETPHADTAQGDLFAWEAGR